MNHQLIFQISPHDDIPYTVDLTEFVTGRTKDQVVARSRKVWAGDFKGRPGLAMDMKLWFETQRPNQIMARGAKSTLRSLFRFLDHHDDKFAVNGCCDLQDHHGILLLRWPKATGPMYHRQKILVDALRRLRGFPPLFWPARPRDKLAQIDDINLEGLRKLYRALKSEGHAIRQMFREGHELAGRGTDPRSQAAGTSFTPHWDNRANHAYLVRELTAERIPNKAQLLEFGAHRLQYGSELHNGPKYRAPGMTSRGVFGIVGKLRWFHPSLLDTLVILWLFLLGTGWNLSTALALDVSKPEMWQESHPQKPDIKVIHAWKGRSKQHQFALSLERPQWHPYQIILFMIERTASLRRTLEHERLALIGDGIDLSPAAKRRVAQIEAAIQSPWLYHIVNKIGSVSAVTDDQSGAINRLIGDTVRRHGLEAEHPELLKITTGDARDAWIGHAYVSSGFKLLVAQYAAQHKTFGTLHHYLNRRRYRAASEASIRSIQNAAFSEIGAGRILDPTRMRMIVEHGGITAEQEQRLLDIRKRTRLGMGCLEPTSPPAHIAPGHVAGNVCRVQRCTGCSHGVVFEDSLDGLTRARAELIQIKSLIPLATYAGSSFEDEERSLDETLGQFDQKKVDSMVGGWLAKIRNGDIAIHDVYPSY